MHPNMAKLPATLSILAVLVIHGVILVAEGRGSQDIKTACAPTPYPELCTSALTGVTPNKTGNTQEMAYWALQAATLIGYNATGVASSLYLFGDLPQGEEGCLADCHEELMKASQSLSEASEKVYPDYDSMTADYDAMITDVRRFLAVAKKKHLVWNCERCRKGESKKKLDAISEGNDLEKIIAILTAFIDAASK
ncbi:unnamed protein product [Alopecurus aequalis]